MVIDSDGRAIVVTRALSNGFRRVEAVFRPKGGTFGDSQRVQNLDEEASWDALAAGPNGAVLLAWGTYAAATNYSLFGAAAGSGTSFGSPKPIQSNIDSLSSPFAALGASGDGLIGWSFINGPLYDGQIAGYDATGPQLRDLAVPASGTVGTPLAFSVQASDIWGPIASTSWAFGDGAGANGTSVSHAFDSAGDRTVTVTATDAVGNASSASAPVSVSAPAPAPPLVCCAPPPDKTPPLVSAFAASPAVFAVGPKATPLVAKVARGTKFRFRSSEAGSLTITIARQLAGKRSGKRCLPPSKKLRKKKSCKRYKRVGTLKRAVVNGQNSIAFSGRLGTRALSIGRYRATLVATDAAGNKARAVDATFRIVKFR
jgi:hypothetical protein